jgi:hypothetical protein
MRDFCAQGLTGLTPELGHETPRGEQLCGPCYFAPWGPTGSVYSAIDRSSSPRIAAPAPARPSLIRGLSGELGPGRNVRRKCWWRP